MKKFLRPIVSGGILAALLCMPSLAAEPAGCTLLVNGEPAAFADALPAQDGEQLYLPAVNILEALDYEVTWDEASQTITARRDGAEYALTVGENIVSYSRPSWSFSSSTRATLSSIRSMERRPSSTACTTPSKAAA